MAETLGSLCDKLTIVKLKQWHSTEPVRLESLASQETQLRNEIDELVDAALSGNVEPHRLTFASNKIYKHEGNQVPPVTGTLGQVCSRIAAVNCELWHEQEKVYEFEKVPADGKDAVVKKLALLNLERNQCIDRIDRLFREAIEAGTTRT